MSAPISFSVTYVRACAAKECDDGEMLAFEPQNMKHDDNYRTAPSLIFMAANTIISVPIFPFHFYHDFLSHCIYSLHLLAFAVCRVPTVTKLRRGGAGARHRHILRPTGLPLMQNHAEMRR
jgi:hypothetical protein